MEKLAIKGGYPVRGGKYIMDVNGLMRKILKRLLRFFEAILLLVDRK